MVVAASAVGPGVATNLGGLEGLEVNFASLELDSTGAGARAAAKQMPLQDNQDPLRELGVQHRTGSVIDLARDPEDSQEVLELLLQGEA